MGLKRIQRSIDYLISEFSLARRDLFAMSKELDQLKDRVESCNSVMDSAAVLLSNLSGQIAALKDDPKALQSLADRLTMETDELASAIAANTVAEDEEPTPQPEA